MKRNHQLGETISKTDEDMTLWKSEKGIVEISKGALALPIRVNDEPRGYVFRGQGKLLLDTIVETKEGAIGRPIEKVIHKTFLMLGNAQATRQNLGTADKKDLGRLGFRDREAFISEAKDLLDRFSLRKMHTKRCLGENRGVIFAFPTANDELDVLVAKDQKLVYKTADTVFASDKNNTVLKSPEEVVVSHNRKSVITKRDCCRIHK